MSYDISFKVKVEGLDKYIRVGDCDANITWNVNKMIRKATGLEWKNEENNGLIHPLCILPLFSELYKEEKG